MNISIGINLCISWFPACECGVGAIDSTCSHDEGRCTCQPGATGDKCDQCEPFHTGLSPSGCQPCSQCEQKLRTNLTFARDEHNILSADLIQFMSLMQANVSGFEEVYMIIRLLQANLTATEQYLDIITSRLETLNSSTLDIAVIIDSVTERVSVCQLDLSVYEWSQCPENEVI